MNVIEHTWHKVQKLKNKTIRFVKKLDYILHNKKIIAIKLKFN